LGPLALAIDDTQWLDSESAAALSYALRRLGETQLVCLFALRLDAETEFDMSQLGSVRVERLPVGPLSLGATQRMLLNALGVTYSRPVIRRLVETSGGNPFYALELARGFERAGGASDEPPALSRPLEALVGERLDAVPASSRRLLGLLSLVPEAPISLLAQLDVLDGLDEVAAAGIVDVGEGVVRFDHPLLSAGAYARLGPEERRGLHAALASALEDPVDRARHLAEATAVKSAETAAELARAATIAGDRGLSAVAADLLEDAVRATPDEDIALRRDRRLLEATFRVRSGSFERAGELLDELLPELPSGDERARALCLRAKVTGDIALQRDLLLRALDATEDPAIRAEINALLVRNFLYTGDLDDALGAARAGEEQARRTGDRSRVAASTTTRGLMEIWGTGAPAPDVLRSATQFAREGGELPTDTYSNPRTLLGARALYRHELDDARREYEIAATAADQAGDVDSLETFWWGLAQLEVRAGRYAIAHRYVESLRESSESFERRPLSVRWIEGVLAAYEGHVEEARDALDETLARAQEGENWFFDAYARSALALLHLSLGHAAAAVDVLEPVLTTRFVVEGDPGQTGILPLSAEAFALAGEQARAGELLALLEERGRELDHRWSLANAARCRGMLLRESGDLGRAVEVLTTALEQYDQISVPFERARALLALGATQRQARLRRAARESLEAARDTFHALGTRLWAGQALAELARIGGRAPSRGELTPNESRIAALVSEGKTNKEVAAELYIAERTVESALTQIYRKLGVRSRTELARALHDRN
jgi:DNA-binding NarL/FixJ family response regulator